MATTHEGPFEPRDANPEVDPEDLEDLLPPAPSKLGHQCTPFVEQIITRLSSGNCARTLEITTRNSRWAPSCPTSWSSIRQSELVKHLTKEGPQARTCLGYLPIIDSVQCPIIAGRKSWVIYPVKLDTIQVPLRHMDAHPQLERDGGRQTCIKQGWLPQHAEVMRHQCPPCRSPGQLANMHMSPQPIPKGGTSHA